ncbi:MAG: phosphoglycolate phosphatase [Gammaproteobacteria bacterium]|nr:phosphoglycolate phosphatase [Gammaproteobacteria bacterium]
MNKIQAVLFDLDGTLADTAQDLASSLNILLKEQGRAPIGFERIRPHASHGSQALISLGFGINKDDDEFESLKARFLQLYQDNLCRKTQLFPGITETLEGIHARGMPWGIVTNKPAFLTDPLVKLLGLDRDAACIISGDTTNNRKPHPEPMLHACEQVAIPPEKCLYVGDAERDIHAGKHAGMKTLVALYGYIDDNDKPEHWGADGKIKSADTILDWIDHHV